MLGFLGARCEEPRIYYSVILGPREKACETEVSSKGMCITGTVGGPTWNPGVQSTSQELFNDKEPNMSINPGETVGHGAAVQSANSTGGGPSQCRT